MIPSSQFDEVKFMKANIRLLAIAAVTLSIIILSTSLLVYADGTATVTDPTNDLLNPSGNAPAPSSFYVAFVDIVQSKVTLASGTYTFQTTVASTPSDWLTSTWNPAFPNGVAVDIVNYRWFLRDSSGTFLGVIRLIWFDGSILPLRIRLCPSSPPACENSGTGSVLVHPPSLSATFNQGTNTVTITISQGDFTAVFPTAALWRGETVACFLEQCGAAVLDLAGSSPANLPS